MFVDSLMLLRAIAISYGSLPWRRRVRVVSEAAAPWIVSHLLAEVVGSGA
jgi:hypothetical protein